MRSKDIKSLGQGFYDLCLKGEGNFGLKYYEPPKLDSKEWTADYFIERGIFTIEDLELTFRFKEECESITEIIKFKEPKRDKVFAFWCIPKIIILGQDPYPSLAQGLAFSCNEIKGSLRNIFLAAKVDINEVKDYIAQNKYIPLLASWRAQGIMLLNCYLTFPDRPKVWENYTKNIISSFPQALIFAWGDFAQKKAKNEPKVLTHCHPSPFTGSKFLTCTHFKDVNYRVEKGKIKHNDYVLDADLCLLKTLKALDINLITWDFGKRNLFIIDVVIKRGLHLTIFTKNKRLRTQKVDYCFIKKISKVLYIHPHCFKVRISRDALTGVYDVKGL